MRHPYGVDVEVLSYLGSSGEDAFGNDAEAWLNTGTVWPGCVIDSQSSEPIVTGREPLVATGKVYGPVEMQGGVRPKDHVKIRGQIWEVVGEVWVERNPFTGTEPGCWFGIRKTGVA